MIYIFEDMKQTNKIEISQLRNEQQLAIEQIQKIEAIKIYVN